jgi:hypothetical protein
MGREPGGFTVEEQSSKHLPYKRPFLLELLLGEWCSHEKRIGVFMAAKSWYILEKTAKNFG